MNIRPLKFLFLFLLTCKMIAAKNSDKISSLDSLITSSESDSSKVNHLISLAKQSPPELGKEHFEYYISALELAKKTGYRSGQKRIYLPLIDHLFTGNMLELSEQYAKEYIEFCEKQNNSDEKYTAYLMMGNLLTKKGKLNEAFHYYYQKRSFDLKKDDYRSYAITLDNMSKLFVENNQYDSALACSFWANEVYKRNNMSFEMANTTLDISKIYLKKEDFRNAHEKSNEALTLYTAINNKVGISNAYFITGSAFSGLSVFDSAQVAFSRSLLFADSLNLIKTQRDCYNGLSQMNLKAKNYKDAYEYNILAQRYNDSLTANLQRGRLMEMEVKLDLALMDKASKDNEINERTKAINRKYMLLGSFLLLGFILYTTYRTGKKRP